MAGKARSLMEKSDRKILKKMAKDGKDLSRLKFDKLDTALGLNREAIKARKAAQATKKRKAARSKRMRKK